MKINKNKSVNPDLCVDMTMESLDFSHDGPKVREGVRRESSKVRESSKSNLHLDLRAKKAGQKLNVKCFRVSSSYLQALQTL